MVCSHMPRTSAHLPYQWGVKCCGACSFEADAENWIVAPFLVERILLPLRLYSMTVHVWIHLICVEDNFPLTSTLWMSECTFNTLRPRQNGRHFTDDIYKCIFLNENVSIAIKISLKFVPKGPINNIPALVQIMACRLDGAVQATSHNLNQWWSVYQRIFASLDLNELMTQCPWVSFQNRCNV